jgi:hypothetical protein
LPVLGPDGDHLCLPVRRHSARPLQFPLACCSASSGSMRAVRTRSMAEGRAVGCPSSSKSWSRKASAWYASQPSRVLRASARASRASHYSRSWRSSALIWSRAPYLSRAHCSSSCRQQTKPMSATPRRQTRKHKIKEDNNKLAEQRENPDVPERHATQGAVDPQCLVQRSVEQGAVTAQLLPQLLLLLSVDEERGWRVNALLPLPRVRCWTARAKGRRGTKRPQRRASSPQPPCGRPIV